MLTSHHWRRYAFTMLLSTVSCINPSNSTLDASKIYLSMALNESNSHPSMALDKSKSRPNMPEDESKSRINMALDKSKNIPNMVLDEGKSRPNMALDGSRPKSRPNVARHSSINRSIWTVHAAKSPSLLQVASGRFRFRRAVQLTEQQKQEALDRHNDYRRKEGASNMEKLKWNEYLAKMASDWADGCAWGHGQPPREESTMPYTVPGQNIFATTVDKGIPFNVDHYMKEKQFYNYDKDFCQDECEHYIQVVWATSKEVGCGYTFCADLVRFYRNSYYYVCNYGPGIDQQRQPYKKGPSCSTCPGHQWCDEGLCNRDCKGPGPHCVCGSACQNCGKVDPSACRCNCPDGWTGPDCSEPCVDKSPKCTTEWPSEACTSNEYIRKACPAMCGDCKSASSGSSRKSCPVDRIAPAYGSSAWPLSKPLLQLSFQLIIEIYLVLCLHNS